MKRAWKQSRVVLVGVLVAALSATGLVSYANAAPSDPALEVVDAWEVTTAATFPDGMMPAQRPALTEAPNGDLLVTFNTSGDAHPGGELRLIRSSDDGRTWGPSEVIATSFLHGAAGSIAATRGITTLADGTILLPYNDAVNHNNYNNRESALFIAKSTDNGVTWTGTDAPVVTPIPIREAHVGGSPIIELGDGTLLLPLWGATELVDNWQTSPMPWRSGVLRSFDGGDTWSEYSTIAFDPLNPQQHPPFHGSRYPSGANELALQVLADGRIAAVIRFATGIGANRGQSYLSYSSDNGATWTPPVAMGGVGAEALSLFVSPCTDNLPTGSEKLLLGHRVLNSSGVRIGRTAVQVSFDAGITWDHPVYLENASGSSTGLGAATGEPTFHRLNATQVLVLFQESRGGSIQVTANLLEDAGTAAECQEEATTAAAAAAANPRFFIERADRAEWPWPYAVRALSYPASTLVSEVLETESRGNFCAPSPTLVLRNGRESTEALDGSLTLAEAGVSNGDVLVIEDTAGSTDNVRVGFNDLDVAPTTRPLYGWDEACGPISFALDYRARSIGFDVDAPDGSFVSAVELRDSNSSTTMTAASYTVFSSADNETYTPVTGWSFSSRVEAGRVIHRIDGLEVSDRYLKVHQSRTAESYSFALSDPRTDATVEFSSLPQGAVVDSELSFIQLPNGKFATTMEVSLSKGQGGADGEAEIQYRLATDGEWVAYEGPIELAIEDAVSLEFRALQDGYWGVPQNLGLTVDAAPPGYGSGKGKGKNSP